MATKHDENITKELSNKLKTAREQLELTQDEVAKLTNISSNYYAKIERGEINVTLKNLNKLIKALKINASEILPA